MNVQSIPCLSSSPLPAIEKSCIKVLNHTVARKLYFQEKINEQNVFVLPPSNSVGYSCDEEFPQNSQINLKPVWKKDYYYEILKTYDTNRKMSFKCGCCCDVFATRLSLLTHSKSHVQPFCVACMQYFDSDENLDKHMFSHHPTLIVLECENQNMTEKQELFSDFGMKMISPEKIDPVTDDTEISCVPNYDSGTINLDKLNDNFVILNDFDVEQPKIEKAKTKSIRYKTEKKSAFNNKGITKTVVSRFGRSRSVRIPEF